jgi:hypothetical protein
MNLLAILVAGTVGKLLFRLFFTDMEDFFDCVRLAFTPDIVSMFRGEYGEDLAQSFKLGIYLFAVIASGAATFLGVMKIGG